MSRCLALALRCGKFVVQQVVSLSVGGVVQHVEFGTKHTTSDVHANGERIPIPVNSCEDGIHAGMSL